ncbi:MAG: ABC transporter substrate-binding protein [Candidatus Binatia bacterium]
MGGFKQFCSRCLYGVGFFVVIFSPRSVQGAELSGRPEKTDIVVTYAQPSAAFTHLWVAYEAGIYKRHGLNVKLQLLNPQVSAQTVVAEEADFYTDGPDLINARLRGARVKYFGGTMQQLVFQIWGAKEIADIQQLKGKIVAATTPRAAIDTATRETLKRYGLTPDKDVKILYVQTVPAVLASVIAGKTSAGTLSAPNTLKAQEAGLKLLADIGKLDIPGLQVAYGTTEKYLRDNPNTVLAFLKAVTEAVVLSRKDSALAKKTIMKYGKIDDPKLAEGSYDYFAPYWAMHLAVRVEAIQAQFAYMDEKEFPQAKNTDARDFFDNSFVEHLAKSGFLQKIGMSP